MTVRDGELYDISAVAGTMVALLENADLVTTVRRAAGPCLGSLSDWLASTCEHGPDPQHRHLLAPNDQQVVKAAGRYRRLAPALQSGQTAFKSELRNARSIQQESKNDFINRSYPRITWSEKIGQVRITGLDGFADAVHKIGQIESELGMADMAQLTMRPPPKK